ncbi:MAG TPA: DNA repair protein RecN [Burkholderiales bacterium]|jgi:DNA repair protein RecN (Recombination protein N)|nr:DNA repair protein RecN [Burkholderiales bacterium]
MLRALAIRDFVIAERVELETGRGFSVLTGETGAGKSILVDAIELLVGARSTAAVVREDAERAELSAEFEVAAGGPLAAWLAEQGLEGDEGMLILRRAIDREGRSRSFINGRAATLAQLREAGEWLVDIHGQHAHQSLLRGPGQRELLDAYAEAEELVAGCGAAWRAWQRLEALAREAEQRFALRAAERAELEEKVAELRKLGPRAGEWDELSAMQRRLAHGSALLAGAQSSLEALSEAEGASLPTLAAVASRLRALCEHDDRLKPVLELLASAEAQAGEAVRELRQYASRVDLDPAAVRATEQRLDGLHAAARKHRVRPEDLPRLAAESSERLAELDLAASPEALKREVEAARGAYNAAARKLSAKRASAAQAFSRAVTVQMQALAMKGGRFSVALKTLETPTASGLEAVELEVSAHPSLPLRPLAQVASGGELSRLSLAIHLVAAKKAPVGTLVFDEVDAGIGGAVAETVGRALQRIGRDRQVLCVTHLPQVAAQADEHWSVTRSSGRRVSTQVARLDRAARIEEIARMLGGAEITATTRKHAAEMLGG